MCALLDNGESAPVVLSMTCLDGYFVLPHPTGWGYEAIAEVMTRADGRGAVASWSPTGQGIVAGHDLLDSGFFEAVFLDGLRSLGAATTAGKLKLWASGGNLELLDTYLLFGDPAMEINALDAQADLQVGKSVTPAGTVLPGSVVNYALTFTNAGPSTAHDIVLTDLVPSLLTNAKVTYTSPEVIGLIPGTTFAWEVQDLPPGASGSIRWRAIVGNSAPPGDLVNTAQIAGAETDPLPDNNTAQVTNQVAAVMRVQAITLKYTQPTPGRYAITGAVRISDLARSPVGGATVQAQWTWPDGSVTTGQAVTNSMGNATFRIKALQTGSYELCVTDVTKAGAVYLPSRNLETCDTVDIP